MALRKSGQCDYRHVATSPVSLSAGSFAGVGVGAGSGFVMTPTPSSFSHGCMCSRTTPALAGSVAALDCRVVSTDRERRPARCPSSGPSDEHIYDVPAACTHCVSYAPPPVPRHLALRADSKSIATVTGAGGRGEGIMESMSMSSRSPSAHAASRAAAPERPAADSRPQRSRLAAPISTHFGLSQMQTQSQSQTQAPLAPSPMTPYAHLQLVRGGCDSGAANTNAGIGNPQPPGALSAHCEHCPGRTLEDQHQTLESAGISVVDLGLRSPGSFLPHYPIPAAHMHRGATPPGRRILSPTMQFTPLVQPQPMSSMWNFDVVERQAFGYAAAPMARVTPLLKSPPQPHPEANTGSGYRTLPLNRRATGEPRGGGGGSGIRRFRSSVDNSKAGDRYALARNGSNRSEGNLPEKTERQQQPQQAARRARSRKAHASRGAANARREQSSGGGGGDAGGQRSQSSGSGNSRSSSTDSLRSESSLDRSKFSNLALTRISVRSPLSPPPPAATTPTAVSTARTAARAMLADIAPLPALRPLVQDTISERTSSASRNGSGRSCSAVPAYGRSLKHLPGAGANANASPATQRTSAKGSLDSILTLTGDAPTPQRHLSPQRTDADVKSPHSERVSPTFSASAGAVGVGARTSSLSVPRQSLLPASPSLSRSGGLGLSAGSKSKSNLNSQSLSPACAKVGSTPTPIARSVSQSAQQESRFSQSPTARTGTGSVRVRDRDASNANAIGDANGNVGNGKRPATNVSAAARSPASSSSIAELDQMLRSLAGVREELNAGVGENKRSATATAAAAAAAARAPAAGGVGGGARPTNGQSPASRLESPPADADVPLARSHPLPAPSPSPTTRVPPPPAGSQRKAPDPCVRRV